MNPQNYSSLSNDARVNATLGPLVDRALEIQNSFYQPNLTTIPEEVIPFYSHFIYVMVAIYRLLSQPQLKTVMLVT